jgi:hypothetical protein
MRRSLLILSLIPLTIPLTACQAESSPKPVTPTTTTPAPAITTTTTTPASAPPSSAPLAEDSTTTSPCLVRRVQDGSPPAWTGSANPPPGMRWLIGEHGSVVGMLFSDPLKSGETDKILWIVKQPRDGNPLRIRATLASPQASITFTPVPPDSGPGEIFPWTVAVPQVGCWMMTLDWGTGQDIVAVPFT